MPRVERAALVFASRRPLVAVAVGVRDSDEPATTRWRRSQGAPGDTGGGRRDGRRGTDRPAPSPASGRSGFVSVNVAGAPAPASTRPSASTGPPSRADLDPMSLDASCTRARRWRPAMALSLSSISAGWRSGGQLVSAALRTEEAATAGRVRRDPGARPTPSQVTTSYEVDVAARRGRAVTARSRAPTTPATSASGTFVCAEQAVAPTTTDRRSPAAKRCPRRRLRRSVLTPGHRRLPRQI